MRNPHPSPAPSPCPLPLERNKEEIERWNAMTVVCTGVPNAYAVAVIMGQIEEQAVRTPPLTPPQMGEHNLERGTQTIIEGDIMKSLNETTRKQVLPYQFICSVDGWITILNLHGEQVVHHIGEIQWQLQNNSNLLDVHIRKMYQGALEYWQATQ